MSTPNFYNQLVQNDVTLDVIDAVIDPKSSRPFPAVGAIFYCFSVDTSPVTISLDNNMREIPLTKGLRMSWLVSQQAFKRLTVHNHSASPAKVKIYFGFADITQSKSALEDGETAVPVEIVNTDPIITKDVNSDAIAAALADQVRCCNAQTALLAEIKTAIQNMNSASTNIPFPSYRALADFVTLGNPASITADVVIAADTPPALEVWQLRANTGAPVTAGDISRAEDGLVIPSDYNASTNSRIWFRIGT